MWDFNLVAIYLARDTVSSFQWKNILTTDADSALLIQEEDCFNLFYYVLFYQVREGKRK